MKLDNLDKWFSRYIRLRDCFENGVTKCVTCGKIGHIKSMHCGHYINRANLSTRFDEQNCWTQCPKCNTYDEGNKEAYTLFLIEKFGSEIIKILLIRKNQTTKFSKFDIQTLTNHYKSEVKRLEKEKGFKFD